MARGWESKAVEAAQEEAAAGKNGHAEGPLDAAASERKRLRDGLLLSRARVLHQLAAAQNTNHRKMLEQALADLDARLAGTL